MTPPATLNQGEQTGSTAYLVEQLNGKETAISVAA